MRPCRGGVASVGRRRHGASLAERTRDVLEGEVELVVVATESAQWRAARARRRRRAARPGRRRDRPRPDRLRCRRRREDQGPLVGRRAGHTRFRRPHRNDPSRRSGDGGGLSGACAWNLALGCTLSWRTGEDDSFTDAATDAKTRILQDPKTGVPQKAIDRSPVNPSPRRLGFSHSAALRARA